MKFYSINIASLVLALAFIISGCTAAKLEARLEANPQCKEVINPKTGALMPCPGSDRAFYREAGLAPAKPIVNANITSSPAALAVAGAANTSSGLPAQTECKPQIHKKSGGTLPCPAPERP